MKTGKNLLIKLLHTIQRIFYIKKTTFKSVFDILRWMYEKKFIYKLEERIISEIRKAGGEELWGISGRTSFLLLYSFVRAIRPQIIVETGVSSGSSSYVILQALEKNKKGILYSIDFHDDWTMGQKEKGKKSGWIIPYNLRHRWRLLIGKSSDLLPGLLVKHKKIDIFFHDSEHTYENMWFEFNLVWDYIKKEGLLLSHDVTWNSAFFDFCKLKKVKPVVLGGSIGFLRKR